MDAKEQEEFESKIKNLPTDELEKNLAAGKYGDNDFSSLKHRLGGLELKSRKEKIEGERFGKTLEIGKSNVEATRNLVKATWGLVAITAILALFTIIKGYSQ